MIYFPFPSLSTLNKFLSKKPRRWFAILPVQVALATLGNSFTRYPWNVSLPDGFEPPTFGLPGERANHMRHESSSSATLLIQCVDVSYPIFVLLKTPTVGFEPTTFGLEVQRASPLRHAGLWFSRKKYRTQDVEKSLHIEHKTREHIALNRPFFTLKLDVVRKFPNSRASVAQLVSAFDC